ncbi:MAG: alpha/beta hydrolase [Acidobacteriota bacterium]
MKSKNPMYMSLVLVFFISGVQLDEARSSLFINPQFPVKVTNDLVYAAAPVQSPEPTEKPLLLDLYEPDGSIAPRLRPGFIVVHGGGLVFGDKRTENMVELCRELAARGYLCVSINYRLRGDDPPGQAGTPLARTLNAAIEDAGRAVAWLRNNAGRYNVDPARIAVGGSSAGAAIVLRLAYGETRPRVSIAAVLCWMGGLDGNEKILDAEEPALFIVHGADDNAVPVSEAYALAQRARRVSIPYELYVCEGLGHNVPLDRRPAGVSLYHRLADFLYEQMDLSHLGRKAQARRRVLSNAQSDMRPIPCPK